VVRQPLDPPLSCSSSDGDVNLVAFVSRDAFVDLLAELFGQHNQRPGDGKFVADQGPIRVVRIASGLPVAHELLAADPEAGSCVRCVAILDDLDLTVNVFAALIRHLLRQVINLCVPKKPADTTEYLSVLLMQPIRKAFPDGATAMTRQVALTRRAAGRADEVPAPKMSRL
jgi:hypothetical protein